MYTPITSKSDENRFQISVALAGFKPDEVELTVEQNVLTLEGHKSDKDGRACLHRGYLDMARWA
jgi:molecular chaperone IbpA